MYHYKEGDNVSRKSQVYMNLDEVFPSLLLVGGFFSALKNVLKVDPSIFSGRIFTSGEKSRSIMILMI